MASGNFEFAYAFSPKGSGLQGKIVWSSTSNGSAANTSNVTAILYARRNNNATTKGTSWSGYVKIQGKDNSNQANINFGTTSVSVSSNWVEMARVTLNNAKHNDNGSGSVVISGSVTGPTGTSLEGVTSSKSQTANLDTIPRKANITNFSVTGRTSTSITLNCTTDVACNAVQIFLNGWDWVDGSLPNTTIGNLTPNTQYSFKARVRRTDRGLWTESNTIYGTTYQSTIPTISLSSKSSTSITVTSGCNVSVSSTQYRIKKANGSYGNYQSSATFSGLEANTEYIVEVKKVGQDSGEIGTATLSVTTYKKTTPTISLSSKTVNSITVTSGCNVTVSSTQYRIKTSSGSYGNYQNSATFSNLTPNTDYTVEVKKVGQDSGESGTATLNVTTYQIAQISSAPNINFGDTASVVKTNPSGATNNLRIETLNPTSSFVIRNNINANNYTFSLTDTEWDTLYQRLGESNSITIRFVVDTICNGTTYFHWLDKTCTLTGNQKTAHVGVNNAQKRAKVFVGVNGSVKRAVIWIGNNGRKRCI